MRKRIYKVLRYFMYILFRPIWWLERLIPRSNKIWLFGAWYGQKYSDNSKWMYEFTLQNKHDIRAIWMTKNRSIYKYLNSQGKPVCLNTSFKGIWYSLRAGFVFLTCGVVDINKYFINGCKQIWLWHGMPLKKIGYSDEKVQSKNKWLVSIRNYLNPYENVKPYATLTSADFFTPFLQDAFNLPKEKIWNTGLPRCDAFFSDRKESFIQDLRKEFSNSKIFLYMPTFRMSSNMDGDVFSSFIPKFGFFEEEFVRFLEDQNVIFLFKPHFVDQSLQVKINTPRFKYITDNDFEDLYVLLNSVDALVTDYSSVYFDFLASKKTIFLLPFDYEDYTLKSRGHYFDMYKEMHGLVAKNWREFYKIVLNLQNTDNYSSEVDLDYLKFAYYLDGNSCAKVIEKLPVKFK